MTSKNSNAEAYEFARQAVPPIGANDENRLASEQSEEITVSSEELPIEERCGLEDIDTIAEGLLVLAPLEQVAEVVAQLGMRWERDVYGQTIQGCGLLVFQFQGHGWTGILDASVTDKYTRVPTDTFNDYFARFVPNEWNWELQAESLSRLLQTKTIYYSVSDSNGSIGYTYWDNGELMERLEYEDAIWEDTHDEQLWESPDRTFEPFLFESKLRQLRAEEIEDSYDFVDNFLCEQQAYAATSLSPASIQRDDLIRLDYIAFA